MLLKIRQLLSSCAKESNISCFVYLIFAIIDNNPHSHHHKMIKTIIALAYGEMADMLFIFGYDRRSYRQYVKPLAQLRTSSCNWSIYCCKCWLWTWAYDRKSWSWIRNLWTNYWRANTKHQTLRFPCQSI